MCRLGNGRPEIQRVADTVPPLHRNGCREPQRADRWLGVGDAAEHRDSVLPSAAHNSGSGADFGLDIHSSTHYLVIPGAAMTT